MKYAQWISSAIYLAFLLLLTPFLGAASHTDGVAGILEVMNLVSPFLGILVLIGAGSSQLSAAVADTIGSGGLSCEVSRGRLKVREGVFVAAGLAALVVWLTDPFQVIAVASRAFALYYFMQCALALFVARRMAKHQRLSQLCFALLGLACLAAVLAGAPAE
jgi:hypothetical protein